MHWAVGEFVTRGAWAESAAGDGTNARRLLRAKRCSGVWSRSHRMKGLGRAGNSNSVCVRAPQRAAHQIGRIGVATYSTLPIQDPTWRPRRRSSRVSGQETRLRLGSPLAGLPGSRGPWLECGTVRSSRTEAQAMSLEAGECHVARTSAGEQCGARRPGIRLSTGAGRDQRDPLPVY